MFLYIVQPDDDLSKISWKYLIDVNLLISINEIQPPYTVYPGQPLLLPLENFLYVVNYGDSLWSISRLFHKDMIDIAKVNNIEPPYIIYPGQLIKIPVPLTFHIVQEGDSLWKISNKYSINLNSLISANNSKPPYVLLPGQYVILPGYNPDLKGKIAYLNYMNQKSTLFIKDLNTSQSQHAGEFGTMLYLSKDRMKISSFAQKNGRETISIYDTISKITKDIDIVQEVALSRWMDWAYDNLKIVYSLHSGDDISVIADSNSGQELGRFTGINANWLNDSERILYAQAGDFQYMFQELAFHIINIKTEVSQKIVDGLFAWYGEAFLSISPDNKRFLYTVLTSNKMVKSGIYDFTTNRLIDLGLGILLTGWSRDSEKLLSLDRSFYDIGQYYDKLLLRNKDGNVLKKMTTGRGMTINSEAWSSDNINAVLVINDNLFIINTSANLITQLTMAELIYDSVWL